MAEAPDVAAMILYHFTAIGNLGMIRAHGLTRGRVKLSHDPQDYVNAISLTTSPLPVGLGLDLGPDDLRRVQDVLGYVAPAGYQRSAASLDDSAGTRVLKLSGRCLMKRSRLLPEVRRKMANRVSNVKDNVHGLTAIGGARRRIATAMEPLDRPPQIVQ